MATALSRKFYTAVRVGSANFSTTPVSPILQKTATATTPPLRVEVIRSVYGLGRDDLSRNLIRERQTNELYRLPDPFVLLKAKLANVAHLSIEKRPQDLKHARIFAAPTSSKCTPPSVAPT